MELQEYKDLNITKQNEILSFCDKNKNKSIVLMPAGIQAQGLMNYLKSHGIDIEYFVDNKQIKESETINNKNIISFEQFKNEKENKAVIITSNPWVIDALTKQCLDVDFNNYLITTIGFHFYSPYEIDNGFELIEKNFEKHIEAFSFFEDDLSMKTYKNRLKYLITNDSSYMTQIVRPKEKQYFEPEIYNLSGTDCFVDCGAFTGDTLDTCLSLTKGKIAEYYAFEPDEANFEILKKKAGKNIHIYKSGVFSKTTKLHFTNTNNAISKVSESGTSTIDVSSIDEILEGKKATFIKMDIEGSEIDALIGAEKTIKKYKPTLAISVYHKFNDLFNIPELIKSFGVDYKYYLRHYMEDYADTVLYAVAE